MSEIKLFVPLTDHRSEWVYLGNWRFYRQRVTPVQETNRAGIAQCIGHSVVYSNPFISQEETDRLMQKWRKEKETGIIEEQAG